MILSKLPIIALSLVPGVIAFVELFLGLPFMKRFRLLQTESKKALKVMSSSHISDHWKEKVLPRYARNILISSLLITFYLVIMCIAFGVVYGLSAFLFFNNVYEALERVYQLEVQIVALVLGIFYGLLRTKIKSSGSRRKSDYTFFSKALHHIALNNSVIKEVAFDIDCMATRFNKPSLKISSPVFIAGLARAGTTILLEALYSTGIFTTLTYRDMPFVTAPYIWRMITKGRGRKSDLKERAHGDRLYVNYDSPEAFEEVFWKTFTSEQYIRETCLDVQVDDVNLTEKYKKFVGNIIASSGRNSAFRYLAKNNNNLLRIGSLKAAFPDSIIIVPFRNPIDHAQSLYLQHNRFKEIHNEDPFSLKYMNWLGHFEFGINFKPFNVHPEALPENGNETEGLNYWLRYWKCVYEYVIHHHASDVGFFNYDKFCEHPDTSLEKLEHALLLDNALLKPFSAKVKATTKHERPELEKVLSGQIKNVYDTLEELSI